MTELRTIEVTAEAKGQRLDQFLAAALEGVSRSRVQLLMEQGDVLVNGKFVLRQDKVTAERPGRVLLGPAAER